MADGATVTTDGATTAGATAIITGGMDTGTATTDTITAGIARTAAGDDRAWAARPSIPDDDLGDDRAHGTHFGVARHELRTQHLVARRFRRLGIRHKADAEAAAARQFLERAALPVIDRAAIGLIEAGHLERLAVELLQRRQREVETQSFGRRPGGLSVDHDQARVGARGELQVARFLPEHPIADDRPRQLGGLLRPCRIRLSGFLRRPCRPR